MTIDVSNVSKRFDRTQALDNVSLKFSDKKIYGFLGNNGAGKSTLRVMICFAAATVYQVLLHCLMNIYRIKMFYQ